MQSLETNTTAMTKTTTNTKTKARAKRRALFGSVAVGVLAMIVTGTLLRREKLDVEVAPVVEGALATTVTAHGRTRVHERYTITAPVSGHLRRPTLHAGDAVKAGDRLASVAPLAPAPLDARTRGELEARLQAAVAAEAEATAAVARADLNEQQATRDQARLQRLVEAQAATVQALEDATFALTARSRERQAAELAARTAAEGVAVAKAALRAVAPPAANAAGAAGAAATSTNEVAVTAPADGRVLRVLVDAEGPVSAGTALFEVGDPTALEVVLEVLTTEAVAITPGADVSLEGWGGDRVLHGRVRRIEPSAFTKVSALGVEEQRVNAIVDAVGDPELWESLGDGFHVEGSIATWKGVALKVPVAALARDQHGWSVFVVRDGRAERRVVEIGKRGSEEAQVLAGLAAGELVAIYPSDKLTTGMHVATAR